jgi:thymidylate synthase (FAD)
MFQKVPMTFELVSSTPEPEKLIALMARICYQSDSKNDEKLIRHLITNGHTSPLEHASASFICDIDRGISHEVVRHRIGVAYSQESTRYCRYSNGGYRVIFPDLSDTESWPIWTKAMEESFKAYEKLLAKGIAPQTARDVLPTCLKTQIGITMNFRAWRWFIALRHSKKAHPKIRKMAFEIWRALVNIAPNVFRTCPVVEEVEVDMEKAYVEWSCQRNPD